MRTCVGCRARRPQQELVRLHLRRDGTVALDGTGPGAKRRRVGRGAYLCRDWRCAQSPKVVQRLARALRTELRPSPALTRVLLEDMRAEEKSDG